MKAFDIIENRLIDSQTPMQVRYLHPILPAQATGTLAALYGQMRQDLQLLPPLVMLSQRMDLMAGVWTIFRESQLVCERVARSRKEALAAAVSLGNACPYCVDAHLGMLTAIDGSHVASAIFARNFAAIADDDTRALVEWAITLPTLNAEPTRKPPYTADEAPEIIGIVLVYQFINRMVQVFLGSSPISVAVTAPWFRRISIWMLGKVGGNMMSKRAKPGESLRFLPQADLPTAFAWAQHHPRIGAAYARFSAVMLEAGCSVPEAAQRCVRTGLDQWLGKAIPDAASLEALVQDVPQSCRGRARLALLTALAPYRVHAAVIEAFRSEQPSDADLLATTTWASYAAVEGFSSVFAEMG